jgi:hypothetical protein
MDALVVVLVALVGLAVGGIVVAVKRLWVAA